MPRNTPARVPESRSGRLACALQRLPGHLEHEALLRIQARRLARGNAEELRIEEIHLAEQGAPADRPGSSTPLSSREGSIRRRSALISTAVSTPCSRT
jgi:hypothetical protein